MQRDPQTRLPPGALSDTHPRNYALDGGGGPVPPGLVPQPFPADRSHTDTWSGDPGAALQCPACDPSSGSKLLLPDVGKVVEKMIGA